jgi:hypothetical protein
MAASGWGCVVAGINDGKNRLTDDARRKLGSILVTPQQPPFKGTIYTVSFGDQGSPLALNKEDYTKLQWLMNNNAEGRGVILSPVEGRTHIRITLDD